MEDVLRSTLLISFLLLSFSSAPVVCGHPLRVWAVPLLYLLPLPSTLTFYLDLLPLPSTRALILRCYFPPFLTPTTFMLSATMYV
jgi:hypothetical protein